MPVQTQLQTRRGTAASWTSTNPTLAAGEFGYETDTGKFKIGNGSTAWASLAYTAAATAVTYLFNATSGQTTFSGADANGLTLAYTVGAEQVYLNGVLQVRGSDYTASNGTSIVLASGALTSDVLNVIAYSAMTITDTYTQAQADAKFFQNANAFVAGKNKIINGAFDIAQRGTSFTGGQYGLDRFRSGSGSNLFTITQEAGIGGSRYAAKLTQTGSNSFTQFGTQIEFANCYDLQNQTVTISFVAQANNTNSGSTALGVRTRTIAGVDGACLFVGANVDTAITLTTTATRYTVTRTLPATFGSLSLEFSTGAGVTGDGYTITNIQMERGSVATAFSRAGGTIAGELAACQRYYEVGSARQTIRNPSLGDNHPFGALAGTHFQVTKRATPTISLGTPTQTSCYTNSGNTENITVSGFAQILLVQAGGAQTNMNLTQPWTASAEL